MKLLIYASIITFTLSSCVSKRVYLESQNQAEQTAADLQDCNSLNGRLKTSLNTCETDLSAMLAALDYERNQALSFQQQLDYFKNTNTNLLERLTDLSVVNKTGAESIRKSLEAINDQNKYIRDLNSSLRMKDSVNMALVMNLKRSLADINDEDVNIEIKKGVVYISLSDKMLYKSGSADISAAAEGVLGKIAKVLNDHKNLEILVEGHTDNVPIATQCMLDNWDLSVKRATAVVRYLQKNHAINPARMTAGGRSEYVPKVENTTAGNKALNRRTEIIILPQLDQFFELLTPHEEQ